MLADGTWAKQEKSKYTPKTFFPEDDFCQFALFLCDVRLFMSQIIWV